MDKSASKDELDRLKEFPSLKDIVYLDHAGTTCVSRSQLEAHHTDLLTHLYGNPHSGNPSSQLTSDIIDQIRYRILKFFNTSLEEYAVIFTSGCTGALKIIGETFDFHGNGCPGNCLESVSGKSPSNHDYCDPTNCEQITNCSEKDKSDRKNLDNNMSMDGHQLSSSSKDIRPSHPRGSFTYLVDSHTSVQGIRELAVQKAALIQTIDCDSYGNLDPKSVKILSDTKQHCCCGNHLFSFPGQSNFSGRKYPLNWVNLFRGGQDHWQMLCKGQSSNKCQGQWFILLDAASLVSTSPLDLSEVQPDFVTLSFYKMFGFPTGLGALLVRLPYGEQVLQKTYFGGGTVAVNIPSQMFHVSHPNISHRFEDGTVSFLDIIALQHGLDALQNLAGGIQTISEKTFSLAQYFYEGLTACRHDNGTQLAEIYCDGNFTDNATQGAIVTFNLRRANGDYVGFAEVDTMAQLYNIHVRTGCFCNTGACQKFLRLSDEDLRKNFAAGHVCGDNMDLIEGRPTGAVRVSFGYMSLLEDAQRCLQFIVECFLDNPSKPRFFDAKEIVTQSNWDKTYKKLVNQSLGVLKNPISKTEKLINQFSTENIPVLSDSPQEIEIVNVDKSVEIVIGSGKNVEMKKDGCLENSEEDAIFSACQESYLEAINVYPIKSCAAFKVKEWPVSARGLLYDREWMVVTESGIAMSQKRERGLCLLQPHIDLDAGVMRLEYPGMEPVCVSLHHEISEEKQTSLCSSKVCGDRIQSTDSGDLVSDWLSEALGRPGCRLIRQLADDKRTSRLKSTDISSDAIQGAVNQLSLANESQYLLINMASVARIQEEITLRAEQGETTETFDIDNLTDRFRANLVVSGCQPFEEDGWKTIQIGSVTFKNQGPCTRCHMVCLNQETGESTKEPLRTLAVYRGSKATFGIHLCIDQGHNWSRLSKLKAGDPVFVDI